MSDQKELLLENLNKSLERLIESHLKESGITNIKISFIAPDDKFNPDGASINIFLYDIRENLELRTHQSAYIRGSTEENHAYLQKSPTHVSFSYIITAWGGNTQQYSTTTEHIISILLQILLLYPHIPEKFLVGGLKNIQPLPKIQVLHPTYLQGIGEFWSALKGKPKPIIHCTVTMPIYPPEVQVPVVAESLITHIITPMN